MNAERLVLCHTVLCQRVIVCKQKRQKATKMLKRSNPVKETSLEASANAEASANVHLRTPLGVHLMEMSMEMSTGVCHSAGCAHDYTLSYSIASSIAIDHSYASVCMHTHTHSSIA